jgi:hypothetical protein
VKEKVCSVFEVNMGDVAEVRTREGKNISICIDGCDITFQNRVQE